jgi:hypothetical protein
MEDFLLKLSGSLSNGSSLNRRSRFWLLSTKKVPGDRLGNPLLRMEAIGYETRVLVMA